MTNRFNDNEIYRFLSGFSAKQYTETKEEVTNKYIKGIINKDEFMKRMKNAI